MLVLRLFLVWIAIPSSAETKHCYFDMLGPYFRSFSKLFIRFCKKYWLQREIRNLNNFIVEFHLNIFSNLSDNMKSNCIKILCKRYLVRFMFLSHIDFFMINPININFVFNMAVVRHERDLWYFMIILVSFCWH